VGQEKNSLPVGSTILLNIRPESINISLIAEAQIEENQIGGIVKTSAYLGSLIQYEVKVFEDRRVKVNVVNPRKKPLFQEGEKVSLTFSSEDIMPISLERMSSTSTA
jgi:ABC-type Fe3+/spermidine/putrescine transport system ATPase subunit